MKPAPFTYHDPATLDDAVALLGRLENARALAGGQSLMPMMNFRFVMPDHIVDLNAIASLDAIRVEDQRVVFGAMTRQRAIERSDEVKAACPIVIDALAHVGHRQTRNRGTIGGSLCHLDPAAELANLACLHDAVLTAPRRGRVQYRLAEPGEVLAAGGRVLTLLDLTDVYMAVFLPTNQVGRVAIGAEARIVLDAVPQYVIPAKVSFIAAEAQFTPREVETRSEREKLMFRVKVKIDPALLATYIEQVKTGLPGEAFVLLGGGREFPERLAVRLPPRQ